MIDAAGLGRGRSRYGRVVIVVVVGVTALCLPLFLVPVVTGTGWSTIRDRVSGLSPGELGVLALVWLAGLFTHTYVATGALPDLTNRRSIVLNSAGSTAAQLAPFGGVLGMGLNYAMLRSWGFTRRHFTVLTLVTAVFNTATKLLLPSIALAALLIAGHVTSSGLLITSAAGLATLVVVGSVVTALTSIEARRRIDQVHERPGTVMVEFLDVAPVGWV
jgi:hypothetical protein